VIRALGMENHHAVAQHAASGAAVGDHLVGTPYPGAFVLDGNGVIVDKRFYLSYRERETGAGLLEAAFGLPSSQRGPEARLDTPQVAVRAYLDAPAYARAQRLHLIVELALAPGLHVYGAPIPEGFLALTIEVEPVEGVSVGFPSLPDPIPYQIIGLNERFFVYQDRVRLLLPLTFHAASGNLVLHSRLGYRVLATVHLALRAGVAGDELGPTCLKSRYGAWRFSVIS